MNQVGPQRSLSPGFAPLYLAPRWLPGGHGQTIYPALLAPRPSVMLRRERWFTPDNDFIDLDFTPAPARPGHLLILFHGLEGSSASHYAQAAMRACIAQGWQGVVPHFRSCSGELNHAPHTYHSGDTRDIDFVLRTLARLYPGVQRHALGVSLGGNALVKWLGEQGSAANQWVHSAASFCPPQDLQAGAEALSRGFNLVYMRNFLRTLKTKALAKLEQHPGLMERDKILGSRNFFDFDEHVTARINGFDSCYDYWQKSSCKPFLSAVRTPLLLVNALNDPFLPAGALARPDQVSQDVHLYYPEHGGHVGFLQGKFPGKLDWIPATAMSFFKHG